MKKKRIIYFLLYFIFLISCSKTFDATARADHTLFYTRLSLPAKKMDKSNDINVKIYYGHGITDQESLELYANGWVFTIQLIISFYDNEQVAEERVEYEEVLEEDFPINPKYLVDEGKWLWSKRVIPKYSEVKINLNKGYNEGEIELRLEGINKEYLEDSTHHGIEKASAFINFKIKNNSINFS